MDYLKEKARKNMFSFSLKIGIRMGESAWLCGKCARRSGQSASIALGFLKRILPGSLERSFLSDCLPEVKVTWFIK
ncbi:MAG: hypothetical protein SV686_15045 [Thermodesulfobacteriota bacterium]|jgi:hypothetical protein|nr:hypothetical protein [Thermodesulfobacteriota bacterium]